MYFNSGWRMSPAEEAIYMRLDEDEREAYLEDGTSAVKLTQTEIDALGEECEAECEWLRQQEKYSFLCD